MEFQIPRKGVNVGIFRISPIDKFIQLACIRYKNQNAVAHGCRDFETILGNPNSKSHRAAIPYIMIEIFF